MADRISKALAKFSLKEQRALKRVLELINAKKFYNLDMHKLKGRDDLYRARKGSIRVIFRKFKDGRIFILAVERRSDNTYKF